MIRSILAVLSLAVSVGASAQSFPTKPIRVYVSSTAGGPLDVFTRLVANKMEERLKQTLVVENRGGAGGNLAALATLAAPPDGHSLLFSIDTTFTVNPSLFGKMPFEVEGDLIPISVLAKFGQMLAVHPSIEARSLAEFVALAKQKDLTYGSAGNALPSHLAFAYLQAVTGIRATHVPYKGNPPLLLALMSGEVQSTMVISTAILQHARAGKLRMLAYSDRTRSEAAPDIPTVAEAGYKDFEVFFAYVLLVAKGTPQPIIDLLQSEATRAVLAPDVRDKLRGVDTLPIALSPADSAAWLRTNRQKWTHVIREMKIRAD